MLRFCAGLLALLVLVGCVRRHSEAIVLEKEHIDARAPTPAASPATTDAAATPSPVVEYREMAPDEIAVDGYVMKAEVRGTNRDPRATADEQWRVKVRTTDNGSTFNLHLDKTQFEKLRAGDRVKVSYRVGKYTGTVWTGDLE